MASLTSLFTPTTTISTLPNSTTNHRRSTTFPKQTHRYKVSCTAAATPDDNEKQLILPETQKLILPTTSLDSTPNVDRRNLLLGLGGLCTAANFTSLPSAFATPITAPDDLSTCVASTKGIGDLKNAVRTNACCPPALSKTAKQFVFPTDKLLRIRPAAHRAPPEYIAKYKAAIQAMKDLPADHPHSYIQQAKIHCAYCNGGYSQIATGDSTKDLQIHNSWLFFPFHRWYLYFYERILGKLIKDPTFALPYWNWDNPAGMSIPAFFEDDGKKNPAFDGFRDARHLPPEIVDLDYNGIDTGDPCIRQISVNLAAMRSQMISNAGDTLSFFGGVYVAGNDPKANNDPTVGSVERGCHTAVHRWVGNQRLPNNEDMGNFYSAGYDPLFYVHHTNVDRMWKVWKDLGIRGHVEPKEDDWLNASYVFYDENEDLVRVYNKDCVDIEKLRYGYQTSPLPWITSRGTPRVRDTATKAAAASKLLGKVKQTMDTKFPLKLEKVTKVFVKRPVSNRTKEDKENANEVLVIRGIRFNSEKNVKFDVFVNDEDDDVGAVTAADDSECAGSFAQLPHGTGDEMLMTSGARFGLTEILEDVGAENDDSILVTLVPRSGCEDLTIAEIKVELVTF